MVEPITMQEFDEFIENELSHSDKDIAMALKVLKVDGDVKLAEIYLKIANAKSLAVIAQYLSNKNGTY